MVKLRAAADGSQRRTLCAQSDPDAAAPQRKSMDSQRGEWRRTAAGLGLSTSMPDLRAAMHRRNSSAETEEYDVVTTCTLEDTCSSTCGSSVTGGSQRGRCVCECEREQRVSTFRQPPHTRSFGDPYMRLRETHHEQRGDGLTFQLLVCSPAHSLSLSCRCCCQQPR
jgi:hypothetical protein